MTEKRFKIADYPTDIEDTVTGEKYPCSSYGTHMEIICDLLNELHEENKTFREALQELKEIGDYQAMTINELHEENQSLKFQLDECQNHKLFSRRELEKENEQLKFQLQNTSDQRDEFHRGARENANRIGKLEKENEQLKQSINNLKDTIIKITIAYQRKYDRNIVDLVDEVHDEDITDLIKELGDD